MKLTKNNLSNGLSLSTAILWVVCTGFVAILPDFSLTVTQWWMHGMELPKFNLGWGNFIWGGITLVTSAWLAGWVLGWSMEVVGKNAKK